MAKPIIFSKDVRFNLLSLNLLNKPSCTIMSFKIFALQLTGKLGDAEKIEAGRKKLEQTYQSFLEAEKSPELERFRELQKWVESGSPEQIKRGLEAEVFKGSQEYNLLKEFESLRKSKPLVNYFKVAGSADLARFQKIEESDKLKNFWQLKDYAEGEFPREMREIQSHKFVGSAEERLLKELDQLKKNKALKAYFRMKDTPALKKHIEFRKSPKLKRFLELKAAPAKDKAAKQEFSGLKHDPEIRQFFTMERSQDLKLYHKMEGRHVLARFEELVAETGTDPFRQRVAFLKDGKKLEKSESWKKYQRYKELEASEEIQFYRKYKKSPLYRNYLDVKDSFQLTRYQELKEMTTAPAFLERKAYLEDTRKWEKSDAFAKLEEFGRLKKHPKVELYHQYFKSNVFDFYKNWEVSFADDFEGKEVQSGKWVFNTLWGDKLLNGTYSQPGDLQGYTGGKNTLTGHSKIAIQVRKEKTKGKQWQPGVGFRPVDFDYSSDILSTAGRFSQKEGIFEARIRFSPFPEVVSSCHLLGKEPSPQLTLVEMGPASRMGILTQHGSQKPVFIGTDLKNLKRDTFYLFRLEWENSHLIWKINDQMVFETHHAIPGAPMHLNLTSLVVQEIAGSKLPVSFETDWVRCYRKKGSAGE